MRTVRRTLALALVTLVGPAALIAQRPTTAADVQRVLAPLADDSMAGRMTASAGEARAARFIAAEMQRIGLRPMGDSGWFQRVPLAAVPLAQPRRGRTERLLLVNSFVARDTFPAERRRTAVNVVGLLEGSDPQLKSEYVLITAHFDHVGIGAAVNGDSIYNGADDDASGVTTALEIARQLAERSAPKRSVLFALWTGEEMGMLGSRWFIENPVVPFAQIVANLEIEMIGRPDPLVGGAGKAWLTGFERSNMGEQLAAAGVPIVADKRPEEHFFERSDNIALARRGVVAHTLSTFNLHADYHQPSDDLRGMDLEHMAAVINAAARATQILADGPKPAWKAGGQPVARP